MSFRDLLERIGILSPIVYTRTNFLVTVYVMSEGTAQGIPRPLQVFKEPYSFVNTVDYTPDAADRVEEEVASILRRGYEHSLADGTDVTYAPHTIYKITTKEVLDD